MLLSLELPTIKQSLPIQGRVNPMVRDDGRGDDAVTLYAKLLLLEVSDLLRPPHLLLAQAVNQLLSPVKLSLDFVNFRLDTVFLLLRNLVLFGEVLDDALYIAQSKPLYLDFLLGNLQLDLRILELILLRLDDLHSEVSVEHCSDPFGEVSSG